MVKITEILMSMLIVNAKHIFTWRIFPVIKLLCKKVQLYLSPYNVLPRNIADGGIQAQGGCGDSMKDDRTADAASERDRVANPCCSVIYLYRPAQRILPG